MNQDGLIFDCTEDKKNQESVVKVQINEKQRYIQSNECQPGTT